MRKYTNVGLIGLAVAMAVGVAACSESATQTTGKKIEETNQSAGQKLDKATTKLGEKSEIVGEVISDSAITTMVKTAILAKPGLSSYQISVDTTEGKVTLIGSVDSQQDIDSANTVASAVDGVKSIDNQLLLKATQ